MREEETYGTEQGSVPWPSVRCQMLAPFALTASAALRASTLLHKTGVTSWQRVETHQGERTVLWQEIWKAQKSQQLLQAVAEYSGQKQFVSLSSPDVRCAQRQLHCYGGFFFVCFFWGVFAYCLKGTASLTVGYPMGIHGVQPLGRRRRLILMHKMSG